MPTSKRLVLLGEFKTIHHMIHPKNQKLSLRSGASHLSIPYLKTPINSIECLLGREQSKAGGGECDRSCFNELPLNTRLRIGKLGALYKDEKNSVYTHGKKVNRLWQVFCAVFSVKWGVR